MAKEPEKYVRKKIRKPRKPMTPEQKAAAVERLAKAREKRLKENPPQYKNIHPAILELESDHPLSMTNVKAWIKTQREIAAAERKNERSAVKGSTQKRIRAENYARSLNRYLEDNVWEDAFYGEYGEYEITRVCTTLAYDANGDPKRTYGVFYTDLGYIFGYPASRGGKPDDWEERAVAEGNESMAPKTLSNGLENFFE